MAKATLQRHNINRKDKFDWEVAVLDGLDNSSDPATIADSETPNTLNTVYDLSGATQTAKGLVKLITSSIVGCTGIAGMHPFYLSDGITSYLVFAAQVGSNTFLYKYNNAGGATLISSALTTGTQWDFTTYKDQVYAVNGYDGIWTWTGSGNFVLVNSLTISTITTRKNRLWGLLRNTSRLVFSDANNPSSWPTNNYFEVNTNDGQIGVGLREYLDSLVVFKTGSVWYIVGEPLGAGNQTVIGNLQLRQVDSDVGCVSFRTIKKTRRGILMWASTSGIVVMQNYHASIISEKVESTFTSGMNPNYMNTMWAVYAPNEKKYILGYPSLTSQTPDSAIMVDIGDPSHMRLSLWDDYPGSCGVLYRFTNKDSVLIGRPDKGFIVQAFQGYYHLASDNGQSTGSNTSTSLNDTTKAWTVSAMVDAKVTILSGTGQGQSSFITANTATGLTVSPAWATTPDSSSVYTIGAYDSYRDTPIMDFSKVAYDKKLKYMNVFTDSEANYPLQFGYALEYAPVSYNASAALSLSGGALTWTGIGGANKWGQAGAKWGKRKQLFLRFEIGDTGKHLQCRVGNNRSNQPWRMSKYSITLKFKKVRPDQL